jgi:cytochrome c2
MRERTWRALAVIVLVLVPVFGCSRRDARDEARRLTGGEPAEGRWAIRKHGCQACHAIPGVTGADGLVGPPLDGIGRRLYLAGHLPNTPENMMRWLQHPPQVHPPTAMPDTGVTDEEARDIAAYLYTLR